MLIHHYRHHYPQLGTYHNRFPMYQDARHHRCLAKHMDLMGNHLNYLVIHHYRHLHQIRQAHNDEVQQYRTRVISR